jgi:hypothetical protein
VPIEMPSLTPMVLKRMPTMPRSLNSLTDLAGQIHQMHIAGIAFVPDAGNSDLSLLHVGGGSCRWRKAWPEKRPVRLAE